MGSTNQCDLFFCTGVAVGTEFCHAESLPITDPTLWTFTIVEHNVIDPSTLPSRLPQAARYLLSSLGPPAG